MKIDGFDWDTGNLAKCQKHGVSVAEVEWALQGDPLIGRDAGHSSHEERLRAVGATLAGRSVFVVFTVRRIGDRNLVRPVSARFMHAKEIRRYETAAASSETVSRSEDR